jgi:hypothetical protein
VKRFVVLCLVLSVVPRAAHAGEAEEPTGEEPLDTPDETPPVPPPNAAGKTRLSPLTWSRGAYERFDPPAWRRQQHGRPLPRVWLAPTVGRLRSEGLSLAGATVAVGYEAQFSVSPELNRYFYGSSFALEARGHVLRSYDGAPASWLIAGGLAVTLNVTEHGQYGHSRVRFPSLFGLMAPEAGVAVRSPQPTSFYLRWSAPLAVLIEKHVAIELVPAASLLYQGARGGVETLWLLGVGVSWRAMGRPLLYL